MAAVSGRQSQVPKELLGAILPAFISTLSFLARIYTRLILLKGLHKDDYILILAWVLGISYSVLNGFYGIFPNGPHVELATESDARKLLIMNFVSQIVWQFSIGLSKISLCTLYLGIFVERRSRYLIYFTMFFVACHTIPLTINYILTCHPVEDWWKVHATGCGPLDKQADGVYATASCNMCTDVLLMAFVTYKVIPLNLETKRKIGVLILVSVGLLSLIASAIRMKLAAEFLINPATEDEVNIQVWTSIEIHTAILCASAPALRPFVRRFAPKLLSLFTPDDSIYSSSQESPSVRGFGRMRSSRKDVTMA